MKLRTNNLPNLTPHVYQYTFASNSNWSRFYPPGAEFEEYLKSVAKKYEVYKNTKFRHRFITARWLEENGHWEVTLERLEDGVVGYFYNESARSPQAHSF